MLRVVQEIQRTFQFDHIGIGYGTHDEDIEIRAEAELQHSAWQADSAGVGILGV